MHPLIRLGVWIKNAILIAVALACTIAIFWGILYKLLLPFTPLWLDEIAIVSVPLALLVAWLIGRSAAKPGAKGEKNAEPVHAVPDAAAQLAQDDSPSSSAE